MQADGLSVMKINVGYGGNQPCMKDIKLTYFLMKPINVVPYKRLQTFVPNHTLQVRFVKTD